MAEASCDRCADLRVRYDIRTPGELMKAIRVARANLSDGTLRDITQTAHSPSGDFGDLPEAGPWPDYVEHYFRCHSCGHGFRLAVDTYHGSGGKWEGEWEPYN
jgi:hypothetical protein